MTKRRMKQILMMAYEKHKSWRGVCTTLRGLSDDEVIGGWEFLFVRDYIKQLWSYEDKSSAAYWLSEPDDDDSNYCSKEGTKFRKNILLDAYAYVDVMWEE